jgi:hypothetical protein
MLSKTDLIDFFEINQGLYNEPASARQLALLHALTQAFEQAPTERRRPSGHHHDGGNASGS